MPNPIIFVVPGQATAVPAGTGLRGAGSGAGPAVALPGHVKASVRVAAKRAGAESVRLSATIGEDAVVLHIAGGPALVLHPETARDLLRGQGKVSRSAAPAGDEVEVGPRLRWEGLEQAAPTRSGGFLGEVLVSAVEIITGLGSDVLADASATVIAAKVDGQVDAGVYALRRDALPALKGGTAAGARSLAPGPGQQPLLVLVHGTFVDTTSTFGKLWDQHPERVRELFDHYGGRVYALDHPTVGASPIENALTLARTLQNGVRLHLVTHSRGGLVAEVLARVAADPDAALADFDHLAAEADWGADAGPLRTQLGALAAELKGRDIRVDRVVRVACPARGTLLASRRLDAYLSVLKWGLELASIPVAPTLLGFLGDVAKRRENWALLPGLAAMTPNNPMVQWLNSAEAAIAGDLRVIAGDLEGDSVGSWIKTLLTDAFYWTDNDIVVQTRSMYGGTPRTGGATFLLDRGGKVTHFNYFANARTVEGVVSGLTQPQPSGFRLIGPLSWAGEDTSGVRGARGRSDGRAPSELPAVFMLPGILGSNLAVGGKRIWLGLRLIGGLKRLKYQPGVPDDVTPDGPIGLSYNDLMEHLSATHEVIPFAFDWRRPIEEEARRLADAVANALDARAASGLPVRLLAHSMGGVLARTMQLERPEVWQRLMARDGARLLMLGTPNGGSWAPMQVLSGDDTFGNALVAFGSPFQDQAARSLMAEFPGFIQLQADLLDSAQGLARSDTWQRLAKDDLAKVQEHNWWHRTWFASDGPDESLAAYTWGVPSQPVLDKAVELRKRLDHQRDNDLGQYADRMLLVTGHAKFTPDGFEWTDDGLVYLDASEGGDGRVTLESALLPGVRTWHLDCAHGSLPDAEAAFPAFVELLTLGDTDKLERLPAPAAGTRGAATAATAAPAVAHVRSRPSRGRLSGALPAEDQASVFATGGRSGDAEPPSADAPALRVSVLNGNLCFVRQPLMVGHYTSLKLEGTERAVDRLIGGAMRESLGVGLYPNALGTHQIFINPGPLAASGSLVPRPECTIVVGIGPEGSLTTTTLAACVRQGVLAWAGRLVEGAKATAASFELATTLIGSGGIGVTPGSAARAIAQGVRDANELLRKVSWPVVSHLMLVELFLERASDAWHGLQVQATATPGQLDVTPTVQSGVGPLRRQVDTAYRGADYDFIRASSPVKGAIEFTLDTHRARSEVRAQKTQGKLITEMVLRASNDGNDDPQIGRTLFQLLVPVELEPFLGGTTNMLLELDGETAGIPWELLDTPPEQRAGGDPRPWAIRCKLVRKLKTQEYREHVSDASADDAVLVIGEPACNPKKYARLPGAQAEAKAVADLFGGAGGIGSERLATMISTREGGKDATTIINTLLARRYRIVHIAGHGEPGADGGVVLSGDTFLGPSEIESMRTVPELVFVNCCHLAAREPGQVLAGPPPTFNRAEFAANVAESLIRIGVRCVVAAGWAVDDRAAQSFATTLYRTLLSGAPFIEAVAQAREAAWGNGEQGNTWAAYQCYGDPNWTYRQEVGDAQRAPVLRVADQYAGVSSPLGLALALEEIAVGSRFDFLGQSGAAQQEKVRHLEARFGSMWGGMGAVAEAFGVAWAEAGDRARAIEWYDRALRCNDGSASLKASEQLGNLMARQAWSRVDKGVKAKQASGEALAAGRKDIAQALTMLERIATLQPTIERLSLCGSAWKRLVLLERVAQDADAETKALEKMLACYAEAEKLALDQRHADLFYPAANRLAAELVLHAGDKAWAGFDAADIDRIRQSLEGKMSSEPDFWAAAGIIELDLVQALAAGDDPARGLRAQLGTITRRCEDLHGHVPGANFWGSVADQAEFLLSRWKLHQGTAAKQAADTLLTTLAAFARRQTA